MMAAVLDNKRELLMRCSCSRSYCFIVCSNLL